jgi:hypothetical protein
MLRDFVYHQPAILLDTLAQFEVNLPSKGYVSLLRFEVISPDSFMWRLLISGNVYYMYAEDYVPGLAHLKEIFDDYLASRDWHFVPAKNVASFESASPVVGAAVYQKPSDAETMMKYAVPSGHDFVFLALTSESTDDAHFSDKAPRGYQY